MVTVHACVVESPKVALRVVSAPAENGVGHQKRPELLRRALRLEYVTVGWNVVEGLLAIGAAVTSGSIALLGFGVDSFVESVSAGIIIWRLKAEERGRDTCSIAELDRKAQRLVAISLFVLAAYLIVESSHALYTVEKPVPTMLGVAVTLVSMVVMAWLARAKRRVAAALGSRAMEADAFQTTACFWLSVITLIGVGLNKALGWWWADPVAAIAMTAFLVKEARQAWRGEGCCG